MGKSKGVLLERIDVIFSGEKGCKNIGKVGKWMGCGIEHRHVVRQATYLQWSDSNYKQQTTIVGFFARVIWRTDRHVLLHSAMHDRSVALVLMLYLALVLGDRCWRRWWWWWLEWWH